MSPSGRDDAATGWARRRSEPMRAADGADSEAADSEVAQAPAEGSKRQDPVDALEAEALLQAHIGQLEKMIAATCRRNGVFDDEIEDFASVVKLKLIENDYAVLRAFRRRSRLTTYLGAVISNCLKDHQIGKRGKWRPSAKARRLGVAAMQLERLIHRHGHSHEEAINILLDRSSPEVTREQLELYIEELPARSRRSEVSFEFADRLPSAESAQDDILARERLTENERIRQALDSALSDLEAEDCLILRLRFQRGLRVSAIAESLGLEQRSLYRRIRDTLQKLRRSLEARGVHSSDVVALDEWLDIDDAGDIWSNLGE